MSTTNEHIELIKKGNKLAFDQLFTEYYEWLVNYAYKFLKEQEASEEVVQDVFFKLWDNRAKLDIKSSIKSYLFRSVHNRCLNVIKHLSIREDYKVHNEAQMACQESVETEPVLENELSGMIDKAINELPVERQKIFRMSRFDGLKYVEIAEQLGISRKTVEGQMGKALQYLRTQLADYLPIWLLIFLGLNQ